MKYFFPAIFFAHGSPMNAIQVNRLTVTRADFGGQKSQQKSAHPIPKL